MKAAPGQLDLAGGEVEDPRVEKAAKALWWRNSKITGLDKEMAVLLWPRVRSSYMATAEVAVTAADSI